LHALGELERTAGDLARAAALLEESATLAARAGNPELVPFIRHGLGDVALAEGDLPLAAAVYRQALKLGEDLKLGRAIIGCVAGIAVVAAAAGEVARAGRLWGAVEMLEQETGVPVRGRVPAYDEIISSCSATAPIAFAAAAEDGRRMTLDQAIAYAQGDAG
jgi:MalT-like TPR region